jgi:EAL domain-containing protein (putative c-di-GMP-specific phosphodiesterase class I)
MPNQHAALPITDLLSESLHPSVGSDAVDKVLHAIRDHLGMDVAFVSEFRRSDRIFRNVDARDATPIHAGDVVSLDQGYCQRVVDGRLPELIPDTRRVPAAMELPETGAIPIGAHLSVPIRLADGRVFGTFCCFSFTADQSLGERDLQMMKVFASVVAHQIDRDMASERSLTDRRHQITAALRVGQPSIVYQPIFDLGTNRLAGLEGLARFFMDPQRGPGEWFAEAAELGMTVELETAAIRSALRALPIVPEGAYLSVNSSPQTILSGELQKLLQSAELDRIVLEITEHDYIEDYPGLLASLAPLRALGLRVAIDDAGAGYASLRHVLHLQPELIKMDVSLTRNIDADSKRRALASALIAFARETQARIVAEGVETEAELRTLKQLGAGSAQGFYLARPLPLTEALRQRFPPPSPQASIAAARRTSVAT